MIVYGVQCLLFLNQEWLVLSVHIFLQVLRRQSGLTGLHVSVYRYFDTVKYITLGTFA